MYNKILNFDRNTLSFIWSWHDAIQLLLTAIITTFLIDYNNDFNIKLAYVFQNKKTPIFCETKKTVICH